MANPEDALTIWAIGVFLFFWGAEGGGEMRTWMSSCALRLSSCVKFTWAIEVDNPRVVSAFQSIWG